jgi:hypothetical protein
MQRKFMLNLIHLPHGAGHWDIAALGFIWVGGVYPLSFEEVRTISDHGCKRAS